MTAAPAPSTTSFATTDLCDTHGDTVQVVTPLVYSAYGLHARFTGAIETLQVFEDNALVRTALEGPGHGRVLVVDGGASLRCALVGGQLGKLAEQNGWAGLLVNGCIRDRVELDACAIGLRALGTCPRKSVKRGSGDRSVPVHFGGVTFLPGHHLYVDDDGILIAPTDLLASR